MKSQLFQYHPYFLIKLQYYPSNINYQFLINFLCALTVDVCDILNYVLNH